MNFWQMILGRFPPMMIFLGAVLSAAIPWMLYRINHKLHEYADPPWKRHETERRQEP